MSICKQFTGRLSYVAEVVERRNTYAARIHYLTFLRLERTIRVSANMFYPDALPRVTNTFSYRVV